MYLACKYALCLLSRWALSIYMHHKKHICTAFAIFRCPVVVECAKIYLQMSYQSIGRHLEIKRGASWEKNFPMCLKMFSRKDHRKRHLKTVHMTDASLLDSQWIYVSWAKTLCVEVGTIVNIIECTYLWFCSLYISLYIVLLCSLFD